MAKLNYAVAEKISLKSHPEFNEAWLQDRIAENPQIIGLGELELLDRERRQRAMGRLDLLLSNDENNERYELELQLGATDESHIIRCIEYWDLEKRRYPSYDHCAVLIAEDVTSRFLNILQLFNGHIPMIIIQLNALQIGDTIVLDFVRVMDRFALRNDDEVETKLTVTDRNYWNARSNSKMVEVADKLIEIINSKTERPYQLNYNKYHIGMSDGMRSRNFIHFKPKKQFINMLMQVEKPEEWIQKLEDANISSVIRDKWLRVTLNPSLLEKNIAIITSLISAAVDEYQTE